MSQVITECQHWDSSYGFKPNTAEIDISRTGFVSGDFRFLAVFRETARTHKYLSQKLKHVSILQLTLSTEDSTEEGRGGGDPTKLFPKKHTLHSKIKTKSIQCKERSPHTFTVRRRQNCWSTIYHRGRRAQTPTRTKKKRKKKEEEEANGDLKASQSLSVEKWTDTTSKRTILFKVWQKCLKKHSI